MTKLAGVGMVMALSATAGCSKSPEAPVRYHVSGTVTLDGQPIPYGEVLFTPDAAKKNSGPQGIAPIKDAKYDTAVGGRGVAGGPTIVRVNGMTGPGGKTLCEYEMLIDLPRADSPLDIAVPKNGGKRPARPVKEI
jgi:hypothetical protein